MKPLLLVAIAGFLASCGGTHRLEVKQYMLRDTSTDYGDDPMVRGEKQRRLYGAISVEEQKQRLGQYYTVLWKDGAPGETNIVFEYQQGGSGSRIKRISKSFPDTEPTGSVEFSNVGDSYTNGGRILSWKVSFYRGGKLIDSKQSYLWR